jgi:hypothetical protein
VDNPKENIDLVYAFMKASEKVGVLACSVADPSITVQDCKDALDERQKLHSLLLDKLEANRG